VKSTGVKSSAGEISSYLGHVPVISDIMSYISYFNASTGYGRGSNLNDLLKQHKLDKFDYLSSEGMQKRVNPAELKDGWGDSNLYMHNDIPDDMPEEATVDILFQCYTKWLAIYTFILIALLVFIIILIKNMFFASDAKTSTSGGNNGDEVINVYQD